MTTTLASLNGAFASVFGGTGNTTITGGFGKVVSWAAWPASAILLAAALTATALQWRAFLNTFKQLSGMLGNDGPALDSRSAEVEVPFKWVGIGLLFTTIIVIVLYLSMKK